MSNDIFFDTNVLVYAYSRQDIRTAAARRLLTGGGVVGVQVLNEFASVARGKLAMSWDEVQVAIGDIVILCPKPRPLTIEAHLSALRISEKYRLAIWDGLIISAALEAKCSKLLTEDMQHGQLIDGLRIENPFL